MIKQNDFKWEKLEEGMAQTKFYFYDLLLQNKPETTFDWSGELDKIMLETTNKSPTYQNHSDYILSVHIIKKQEAQGGKFYFGYFIVGEDEINYSRERKGEFLELGFEENEHLCHNIKGKLNFLIWVGDDGKPILMFERQYFSLNIKGFVNYFKQRYSNIIEELRSRNIIGKDLKSTIQSLKENKVTLVRLYFKKYAPEDRIKQFGYVEEVIPNLLQKGIYADISLRWENPPNTESFFKKLFSAGSFEEALNVDFGELLKIFTFDTDNDTIPQLNLLDKIIYFMLPRDKTEYDDNDMFITLKEGFEGKKDKLV